MERYPQAVVTVRCDDAAFSEFWTNEVESLHCNTPVPTLSAGVLARMLRSLARLNSACVSLSMCAATFHADFFAAIGSGQAAYTLARKGSLTRIFARWETDRYVRIEGEADLLAQTIRCRGTSDE